MSNARTCVALLMVCAFLAAACGSRITEEQRQFVLAGGGGGAGAGGGEVAGVGSAGSGTGAQVAAGGGAAGAGRTGSTAAGGAGAGAAGGGAAAGGAAGGAGGGATGAGTPNAGGGGGNTGGGGGGGGGIRDTRAAPPGGNGGATDKGVTEDKIVIGNASDISGAVPGLFQDAQLAVKAYLAYFAAAEGTIYGRALELLPKDTQLNSAGNRNAYLDLCDQAFGAAGSMSPFEQGAAPVVNGCKIPDLRTAAVSPEMISQTPTAFSTDAMKEGLQPMAEYAYWQKQSPQAVKKAAYLWIAAATTDFQTDITMRATSKAGYDWVYTKKIDIAETNYAPFVLEMKDEGVQFVTFQGAYQQAVRLAEAMRDQGFKPRIFALQSNAYTPNYIGEGGSAVEGTQVAVPNVLLEEINQHDELKLYAQWLNQVKPGEQPTGQGVYAWAAARLFVDTLKRVGPNLTRARFLDELKQVTKYDGNGLLPAQNIGGRYPADCVVIVTVKGGRFVRTAPSNGYTCAKPIPA